MILHNNTIASTKCTNINVTKILKNNIQIRKITKS